MSVSIERGIGLGELGSEDPQPSPRSAVDRRKFTWQTVLYGFCRSRRRHTRRTCEIEPIYTDYHHPWLFFLATGIMILSTADAFLTLQLLDRGAVEINPVMALVIGQSTATFAATKMLFTSVAILVLVFLARAMFLKRIRTGLFLTFFFSAYATLVCYEFVLLIGHF